MHSNHKWQTPGPRQKSEGPNIQEIWPCEMGKGKNPPVTVEKLVANVFGWSKVAPGGAIRPPRPMVLLHGWHTSENVLDEDKNASVICLRVSKGAWKRSILRWQGEKFLSRGLAFVQSRSISAHYFFPFSTNFRRARNAGGNDQRWVSAGSDRGQRPHPHCRAKLPRSENCSNRNLGEGKVICRNGSL